MNEVADSMRSRVERLERTLEAAPQAECPLRHQFAPGVAVSGILMVGDTLVPAASSATFRVHKTATATFTVYRVT